MLIPYLTVMFPAWVTILLVLLVAAASYFYHKVCFEAQSEDIKKALFYVSGKLDEMNEHLVEQGLEPLNMEVPDGE